MLDAKALLQKDLKHIWHPCSQMKDFETCPPIVVNQAKGSWLYTNQGTLIDAQSSWWCKSLGHGHPEVMKAIKQQMNQFEHVIAANTTHAALAALGEKLAALSQKQHLFFASDGSSAVEIALKLAIHSNILKGQPERKEFIALKNAYHGETLGTLAVSDLGIYKKPYEGYGPTCHFIDAPYLNSDQALGWSDAKDPWQAVEKTLENLKDRVCAVIVEPIIQGAAGLRLYSADFLKRLANFAKANDILLIADEIMTGMCRTGEWFASELAGVSPDMICLSKGLTSGTTPFSLVLIDHAIYRLFFNDYNPANAFLHSHTYSGNALGVAAALATIQVMETENIREKSQRLGQFMLKQFQQIATSSGKLENVRSIGAIVAAELALSDKPRPGFAFYQQALKHGALIRPIGRTLYWMPPLNTDEETLVKLAEITLNSINAAYR